MSLSHGLLRMLVVLALLVGPASAQPDTDEAAREVVPEAARADLDRGSELYRKGDYQAALTALETAEKAGARSGLLFYEMAYCHQMLGHPDQHLALQRRSIPYFERQVAQTVSEVEPYYYLAAIYYQEPADREAAARVVGKAIAADAEGKLSPDLDGEALFRLGRLYSFALELGLPGHDDLERRRVDAYRKAAVKLRRLKDANKVYLLLSLEEVAKAAEKAENWDDAIQSYSLASMSDVHDPKAARALLRLGSARLAAGDIDRALAAWSGVRGPNDERTRATYGIHLLRQVKEVGTLPKEIDGVAIAGLDRAALEHAILDAAQFLKEAAAAGAEDGESGGFSVDPEAQTRQKARFLALMIAYLESGYDLRTFAVQYQLVPLVFERR